MLGIIFVLLSSFIYGIEPSIRTLALESGITPAETMILSSFTFFVISLLNCAIKKHKIWIGWRQALRLLAAGSLGMGATSLFLAMSYQYIPVGCATVIHFMYPSLVCIAMALFFRERLTWKKALAMVLSIVGVALISGGGFAGSMTGVALALVSSFTYTFYIVMIDRGQAEQILLDIRLFYITLGCFLFSFLYGLTTAGSGKWNLYNGGIVIFCGILAYAAAFFFAGSVKRIGASRVAFFSLFEPITSMVFSTLVYHYSFSMITVFGCILSLAAILMTCVDGRKER